MSALLLFALTVFAALGAGLIAGLFFAFSVSVMTALGRLPPVAGISAMQSINVAILNPVFFAVFFGTAAASAILVIAAIIRWDAPGMAYLLGGGALYLVGGLLVTVVFNVPMNKALAAVEPDSVEGTRMWRRYLSNWTGWNHARTVSCLAAAASFLMALR